MPELNDNSTMPVVPGNIYVHQQGSFFRVASVADGHVLYARLGDGAQYALTHANFCLKMRIPEAEELVVVNQYLTRFEAAQLAVTRDNLSAAMQATAPGGGTQTTNRRRRRGEEEAYEPGFLVEPEERYDFDRMVLSEDVKTAILTGINSVQRRAELEAVWGVSQIQPLSGRCILNLWGPSGVGKTMSAKCIARRLGKKLYQVDYASIISKWEGDTAKHIKAAFAKATEHEAILFFDEADSLLSKRMTMTDQPHATSINQNRNCLMQELDRFNGIVILSTNLFGNYDEALLRRIARHIQFSLPDAGERKQLLELHLPVNVALWEGVNSKMLADTATEFSGGDILNVVVNAIETASLNPDSTQWKLTDAGLLREINAIRAAKKAHKTQGKQSHKQSGPTPLTISV